MKKTIAILVTTFVITSFQNQMYSNAAQANPGAKCSKAGSVVLVGNKKFTCIKKGKKFVWNSGVVISAKPSSSPTKNDEINQEPTTAPNSSTSQTTIKLVKYKNCTEAKAAGAAPLLKSATPELYELNSGLDRDKDGVACEN